MAGTTQAQYPTVGARIRALRQERQWTQQELARRTKLNISTISLIESSKRTGTLDVHRLLARAFNLTLSELYAGLEGERQPAISFQPAAPKADTYTHPGLGFAMQPLTSNALDKRMMPLLVELAPGGATVQEQARPGSHTEKFIYVQAGALEVRVDDQTFTLRRQQSLYFDATLPHQLRNLGTEPASAFVVISPPML